MTGQTVLKWGKERRCVENELTENPAGCYAGAAGHFVDVDG